MYLTSSRSLQPESLNSDPGQCTPIHVLLISALLHVKQKFFFFGAFVGCVFYCFFPLLKGVGRRQLMII